MKHHNEKIEVEIMHKNVYWIKATSKYDKKMWNQQKFLHKITLHLSMFPITMALQLGLHVK